MRLRTLPGYLVDVQREIEAHAKQFGLDIFEQIYELLDYKTMNEVASYGGFPTRYPHWRFGMEYERLSKSYSYGLSKIYEMVINNDPCYAYLLEGNSIVEQKLVIAHVCGHNDFFKNNFFFSRTNRRMIDEMANHATRVRRHMERVGTEIVESFIDVCLSLDNLIDPMSMFIRRERTGDETEAQEPESAKGPVRLKAKSYMERYINPPELFAKAAQKQEDEEQKPEQAPKFPAEPQRDVLQFLLEHAPLDNWQRDILEIVRKEAYYFAPQAMTKIMNEGWAVYWHSKIMTQKALTAAEVVDYADLHAGVLSGGMSLNPYKIGLELFRDIEHRWNTGRFGKEWDECTDLETKRNWDRQLGLGLEKIFQVRSIYNDITFIEAFFTEDFCREQLYYSFGWNERSTQWEIQSRQYQAIRAKLLAMLTNHGHPFIYVENGNFENRGELLLRHRHDGIDLDENYARDTMSNLFRVWRRPVNIETMREGNRVLLRFDGKQHAEKAISAA